MAIIQSILVGKGRGKIGNVVLSSLNGQTVAKQLNSSPKNSRTDAQIANRVKMANAVLAWQFLANFMGNAKVLRKPLESVYNAFVRSVVSDMSTELSSTRIAAAKHALNLRKMSGNWVTIASFLIEQDSVSVTIGTAGLPYVDGVRIRGIQMSVTGESQEVIDEEVSLAEWNISSRSLVFSNPRVDAVYGVYLYTQDGTKISNVLPMVL